MDNNDSGLLGPLTTDDAKRIVVRLGEHGYLYSQGRIDSTRHSYRIKEAESC